MVRGIEWRFEELGPKGGVFGLGGLGDEEAMRG